MPTINDRIAATREKTAQLYAELLALPLAAFAEQDDVIEQINALIRADSQLILLRAQFDGGA